MNYSAKREERRRRAMRAVMLAVGALRDRMFELYWETPSGGPAGDAWSGWPLRREYDRLRALWRGRTRRRYRFDRQSAGWDTKTGSRTAPHRPPTRTPPCDKYDSSTG